MLADLQAKLGSYRKACKTKSSGQLLKEKNHPTDDLAKHLTAIAESKPSRNHDAHHIIMGKDRWQKQKLMISRLNLHQFGDRH
ncbi:hypothetical protein OQJ59_12600 [Microbulbifer thermotolerans]|uniref:hypothetical protein n=1 Tax=Microbulbifer thermotolerans TaxID=252514 RepID=UPI00224B7E84|nr:hypothetical protein [Microbulbifer thermotolerans]MCX2842461.1 hypothetical protein [Microbulbifer thermotolerans]